MDTFLIIVILAVVVVLAGLGGGGYFMWMRIRYKTVKANQAMLITGNNIGKAGDPGVVTENGRLVKVIRGGGHLLRRFQNHQIIDLTSFQLELNIPRVSADGGIPIKATATAQVTVSDDLNGIVTYAEQFSSKVGKNGDTSQIEMELKEILEGNLRTVLSAMSVEDILVDRQKFNDDVVSAASDQLKSMGFKLTSLVLKDVDDADKNNPYIENLGRSNIAKVRKNAEIAEADNDREARIHVAEQNKKAEEEELKRKAELDEVRRETELQQEENRRQVELAKVQASKAKELEEVALSKKIQEEQLNLAAKRKEEELRIAQMEKDRQVDIEKRNAEVRQAKADADFYETTKKAEADAKKAEIDGQAKAKIEEAQGLAMAKVTREKGLAEAEVIRQKGSAEAESKRLLAEAIAQHGEVVIVEKLIEMLPLYAREIAAPLSQIESVKIMDMGGGNGTGDGQSGVSQYAKSITQTMTQLQEPLKELTGIDVTQLLSNMSKRGVLEGVSSLAITSEDGKSTVVEKSPEIKAPTVVPSTLDVTDTTTDSETAE